MLKYDNFWTNYNFEDSIDSNIQSKIDTSHFDLAFNETDNIIENDFSSWLNLDSTANKITTKNSIFNQ